MPPGTISVPDLKDHLLADATTELQNLGLGIEVVPGPDGGAGGGEEPRVESNGPGFDPGTLVNPGTTVGVVLYPFEPRQ